MTSLAFRLFHYTTLALVLLFIILGFTLKGVFFYWSLILVGLNYLIRGILTSKSENKKNGTFITVCGAIIILAALFNLLIR
ncbi:MULTISPECIES: hypothetical protein [Bacillus]|uniref:hypothetical protein n=1 Tax=Bacillus TaxID=1386 RepID=UPI000DC1CBFA|nr:MULTISPECIES: hypothetical protein [Bacillus]AWX21604.1 hypothetical protein CXF51_07305 [Bacillus subtilis subsp. subtilis]MDI6565619.1 hypothetical protein [Bacillus subtilis]MEC1875243.1 hypothetical protein [Bacillus subtilis]MEC1936008.1 hypothetical protein [Bacillus subtilis]UYP04577.1 hypothetical protein OEG95_06190 [Bacillus subtilis]